jgi:hypothetical protein
MGLVTCMPPDIFQMHPFQFGSHLESGTAQNMLNFNNLTLYFRDM